MNSPVLLVIPSLSLSVGHIWRTGGVSEPQGMVEPLSGKNRPIHIHTHTLTHSCMPHMHTHKHRHAYTYTHHTCMLACKCMHAQLLTYICMYTDSHITCEYLHACSHIHTPAHLHKYTLRNTHTHTLAITAPPPLYLHMSSKQPPCVQPWGRSCGPQLGLH